MTDNKSPGDSWRTPQPVFDALNEEFEFVADMASSKENALCDIFFTEKDDSLSINWFNEITEIESFDTFTIQLKKKTNYVWLNCPYSNPMPWVKKAAEAQLNGLGVVMLLNADCSVGWFAEALKTVSEIRFIVSDEVPNTKRGYSSGRIGFLNGDGDPINGNNKPQFILIFNPFKIGTKVTSYINKSELYK